MCLCSYVLLFVLCCFSFREPFPGPLQVVENIFTYSIPAFPFSPPLGKGDSPCRAVLLFVLCRFLFREPFPGPLQVVRNLFTYSIPAFPLSPPLGKGDSPCRAVRSFVFRFFDSSLRLIVFWGLFSFFRSVSGTPAGCESVPPLLRFVLSGRGCGGTLSGFRCGAASLFGPLLSARFPELRLCFSALLSNGGMR